MTETPITPQPYDYYFTRRLSNVKHRSFEETVYIPSGRDYVAQQVELYWMAAHFWPLAFEMFNGLGVRVGSPIPVTWEARLHEHSVVTLPIDPNIVYLAGQPLKVAVRLLKDANLGRQRPYVTVHIRGYKGVTKHLGTIL